MAINESVSVMNEMADTCDKIAGGSLEGHAAIAKIKEINTKRQEVKI